MSEIDKRWAGLEVGDLVNVKHIWSGDVVKATVYRPEPYLAPWTFILGWPIRKEGSGSNAFGLGVAKFELLDVFPAPKPPKPLPETPGSIVKPDSSWETAEVVLISDKGWFWTDTGNEASPDKWPEGWLLIRDAGKEAS
jgi:hypothetical protein